MSPAPVWVRIPGSHHPGTRLCLVPGFRDPGSVLILGQVTQYGNPYLICITTPTQIEPQVCTGTVRSSCWRLFFVRQVIIRFNDKFVHVILVTQGRLNFLTFLDMNTVQEYERNLHKLKLRICKMHMHRQHDVHWCSGGVRNQGICRHVINPDHSFVLCAPEM